MNAAKTMAAAALALLLAIAAGAEYVPTEANIRVLSLSYDPAPAEPGRQVEVSLKVDNFASTDADGLVLEVRPSYPFTMKPGEDAVIRVGRLAAQKTVYRTFNILVADDALEDAYSLSIAACPSGCAPGRVVTVHKMPIDIRSGAAFTLDGVSFSPDVLSPGERANVTLSIRNTGLGKAKDAKLSVATTPKGSTDSSLFYLVDRGNALWLGDIGARSVRTASFALGIGEGADGIYALPLTLTYTSKGAQASASLELALNVRKAVGRDVLIAGASSDPERVPPGGSAQVTLTLRSAADVPLRNLVVSLDLSGEAVPFATRQSSSERVLESLPPGAEGAVRFDLVSSGSAAPGIYKVPVALSYFDSLGRRFTRAGTLTLVVGAAPALALQVASPDLFKKGTTQAVKLDVMNTGAEAARSLVATLRPPEGVEALSSPTVFVESLAASSKATVSFTLHVDEGVEGAAAPLSVALSFRDTQGRQYSSEASVPLRVYGVSDPIGQATGEVPRLQVGLEKSAVYKAGQKGTVTLNFVNKGTEGIRFLVAEVAPTGSLEVLSSPRMYVGKLDSDDYETAEYTVNVKAAAAPGELELPVTLEYQDAAQRSYRQQELLKVAIYGPEDVQRLGLESKAGAYVAVFAIAVLAVMGYVAYRFLWRRGAR